MLPFGEAWTGSLIHKRSDTLNRKVPDVCRDFGVPCLNLYALIEALDFTTD